jgi:glycolate oxidase iron-sulfur subunit
MCLPVCPTYALTQQEESSPRGRIRLIRSLHDGTLELSGRLADEMHFCLDCQACQTACPAGVRYGALVEDARNEIADRGLEPFGVRLVKRIFLRGVLSSPARLRFWGRCLYWYHRSGLRDAVDGSGILALVSERVRAKHQLLPRADEESFAESTASFIPARAPRRGSVAFLSGCVMNISFAGVHRDAVEVLTRNGYDVLIPPRQGCCGSLHGHNGDARGARELARSTVDAFGALEVDAFVIDSAGCSAFLKEYGEVLADEPDYALRAAALAAKTREITEFLHEVGLRPPTRPLNCRVTYHEACHLVHTQKVSVQPRSLIALIPGVTFVELGEATWCCGSAGIYNIVRFDDSMRLLDRKMGHLSSTDADIVLAANPGCHLQLEQGIRSAGLTIEVLHPVSLLNRAYKLEP